MSQRHQNAERRIKRYTKITCREQNDFLRGRECTICDIFAPYDTKLEWNRHLAMHEKDGTLTKEQYDAFMNKLIRDDAFRMEMSYPED